MSESETKAGKRHLPHINVEEERELREWARRFQVEPETIRAAIKRVGPMVEHVERYLTSKWAY